MKINTLALGILSAMSLAACTVTTTPVPPENPIMLINTVPSEAQLTFDTGFVCTSPCKVELPYPMTVKVAKAGFVPQENLLEWLPAEEVIWVLELAAPTTEVEEQALPEL